MLGVRQAPTIGAEMTESRMMRNGKKIIRVVLEIADSKCKTKNKVLVV